MEVRYIISLEPQYDEGYDDWDCDSMRETDRWTVRASAFIYREDDSDSYSICRTVQVSRLSEYVRDSGLPLGGLLPPGIAQYLQDCIAGEAVGASIVQLDVRFRV